MSVTAIMPEKVYILFPKNIEIGNWDPHSEPKLKVPRLFILPAREMEQMGEKNWVEEGGGGGHRGLWGWEKCTRWFSRQITFINWLLQKRHKVVIKLVNVCSILQSLSRPGEQLIFQKNPKFTTIKGGTHVWMFAGLGGLQYMASQPSLSI